MSEGKPQQVVVAPKFEDIKSPDYKYIFSTGVFGGLDPNHGRFIFYIDRAEPETVNEPVPGYLKVKTIVRELQVEVHVSPSQFKTIWMFMGANIKRYEETYGEIPTGPKVKEQVKMVT